MGILFDDIPYLAIAKKNDFCQPYGTRGLKCCTLKKLAAEALAKRRRKEFLNRMIAESVVTLRVPPTTPYDYLYQMTHGKWLTRSSKGAGTDIGSAQPDLQSVSRNTDWPFLWTQCQTLTSRGILTSIGDGISINKMTFPARQRESDRSSSTTTHGFAGRHGVRLARPEPRIPSKGATSSSCPTVL